MSIRSQVNTTNQNISPIQETGIFEAADKWLAASDKLDRYRAKLNKSLKWSDPDAYADENIKAIRAILYS